MAQGLLTATLPTNIGGEMNYIARTLDFEFLRPVYADEIITCETEMTRVSEESERPLLASEFVCTNEAGTEVLRGESDGLVPKQGITFLDRSVADVELPWFRTQAQHPRARASAEVVLCGGGRGDGSGCTVSDPEANERARG